MNRAIVAVVLAAGVGLGSGYALAQPVTPEAFKVKVTVEEALWSLAEALPTSHELPTVNVVSSPRYAVFVSAEAVTVTTGFLGEASRRALVASVAYQLLRDPVYFAITMDRAGFDGPGALRELQGRLLYDVQIENLHRVAVNVAYADMNETIRQNSFWVFARPGFGLMYRRVMDAATIRYYLVLAGYRAHRAAHPAVTDVPPISVEFIREVGEVTAVLRGGDPAEVSPWRPSIEEALKAYPSRRME